MSWLTDTLIATGALIALVLVLRRPVARWFGPGMAYALWALPLLRLVLPPLVLPEHSAPSETVFALADAESVQIAASASEPAAWPFAEIAVALWLAGALGFLVWRVASYRRMRRAVLEAGRPVGEVGAIRMVESPAVPAPVAFGLRDKVIALPPGFMASEDRTARDLAIAHELEHHLGRDIAVNFAVQPLLALHWFNPLAWAGWRALRRDQEAACDARVLAGRCAETRAAYARLIAGFAQRQPFALAAPLACPVVGEKSIVYRLRSLTMTQPSPARRRIGRLLIGAAALALPLTATITYAASEPEPAEAATPPDAADAPKTKVEKHVLVIKHKHGEDGEPRHVRTMTRDGRTIVIKSDQPVAEAELEARLAGAEALAGEAEARAEAGEARVRQVRTMVLHRDGGEWTGKGDHHAHAALACADGKASEAHATADKDGKKQVVRVKLCAKGGDMTKALAGLRQARAKVAADASLPGEIKAEVLEELDDEIERLSEEG